MTLDLPATASSQDSDGSHLQSPFCWEGDIVTSGSGCLGRVGDGMILPSKLACEFRHLTCTKGGVEVGEAVSPLDGS